jgi:hypothetical protein
MTGAGLAIAGLVVSSLLLWGSYTVRDGRRRSMATEGVRTGLVKSLYVIPLVFILIVVGLWLGWLP